MLLARARACRLPFKGPVVQASTGVTWTISTSGELMRRRLNAPMFEASTGKAGMPQHLPEKISRTIGDFYQIDALVAAIEHQLEKRMVARHGTVKLDALVPLLARYKNVLKAQVGLGAVAHLNSLIARLRKDLEGSPFEVGRDAFSAHALKLDLQRIFVTWKFMNVTTFSILRDDLKEIDAELEKLEPAYISAPAPNVDLGWRVAWRDEKMLGDPRRYRFATIYPGLATVGVVAPLSGGAPAQDAIIRACGLATFLNQTIKLIYPVPTASTAYRLLCEQLVNDFMALWELLFDNTVTNDHGVPSNSVVGYWEKDGYAGATTLRALEATKHPLFESLRLEVRNKHSAHIDPNVENWRSATNFWPMKLTDLEAEIYRVLGAIHLAAKQDVRTRFLFGPPQFLDEDVVGLSGQEGLAWEDG